MKQRVPYTSPGDVISAGMLTKLAQGSNRHDNPVNSPGISAIHTTEFSGQIGVPPVRVGVARILRDILPDFMNEANTVNKVGEADAGGNAVLCLWDSQTQSWQEDGRDIVVQASKLPLLEGEECVVTFHRGSSTWVVLEREFVEAVVEVISTELNADGYQDGYLLRHVQDNEPDNRYEVIREIHVVDVNAY